MRLPLLIAPLLLPLPLSAFQNVHVVQGGGAALQAAIDAASDGDTVLVQPGSYVGCAITGKGLTVVADAPGVVVDRLRIASTVTGQVCTVAGLRVVTPPMTSASGLPDCIVLENCAGSVRLEAIENQIQTPQSTQALAVIGCADVALVRCNLTGSSGTPSTAFPFSSGVAGAGLACAQSQVAAYDCTLRGGDGNDGFIHQLQPSVYIFPPTVGAPGASVDAASIWFASAGTLRGGEGGAGVRAYCDPFFAQPVAGGNGQPGGAGLAAAAGAAAHVLGTTLLGGAGGLGGTPATCSGQTAAGGQPGAAGAPSTGSLNLILDTPLSLVAPTHVRSGQPIALSVAGTPGDVVFLALSLQSRWELNLFYEGVFLFGPSGRRAGLGMIPGSGTLPFVLPSESLPPGVLARQRHLQVLARAPSGLLQLGSPAVVTILDPSF